MSMPFVTPQLPKFVVMTEDSNNLCCFIVEDIYLLCGRRAQATWICPYSPVVLEKVGGS